jgi:hypothetical protein
MSTAPASATHSAVTTPVSAFINCRTNLRTRCFLAVPLDILLPFHTDCEPTAPTRTDACSVPSSEPGKRHQRATAQFAVSRFQRSPHSNFRPTRTFELCFTTTAREVLALQ